MSSAQSALACAPKDPVLELDEGQFRRWALLLEERTGMQVPPERRSFLATGIGLRMREIGCRCPDEYLDRLTGEDGAPAEWSTLVDRLTVHETRFYRHSGSMALVAREVDAKAAARRGEAVRFEAWSVGCATGEETYTLAMVIDHALEPWRDAGVRAYAGVVGSDISRPALRTAREAVYPANRIKDLPAPLGQRYLHWLPEGRARVTEDLRRRVCFVHGNVLAAAHGPFGPVDLVFCQNLLIYFDRHRRAEIAAALVGHLRPGGVLILGAGELLGWRDGRVEKLPAGHTCAYRRVR